MIFIAYSPEKNKKLECYATVISEAATIFAKQFFGNGWGRVHVAESDNGASAIIVAPNRRPFRIDALHYRGK